MTNHTMNGSANGKPRRKRLTDDKPATSGYEPIKYTQWFMRPRDLPPFSFSTILAMLLDPTIRLGLAMRSAPLFGAEFAYQKDGGGEWTHGVKADNRHIADFVLRQFKTIWQNLDALVPAQTWGWAAAEVQFCLTKHRTIEVDRLIPRHSNDTRALVRDGEVCGVRFLRIKHSNNGRIDLPFPKAIFHAYAPDPGCEYGNSVLNGAYSPWADKWLNGGALDTRRLFMHKDAYGGGDMGYPPGSTNIDGKGNVPNRDIAREIVEQYQSGSVTTRPSQIDPVTGKELWPFTRATVPSNPQHILQYPKDLDTEELRGMEIPDEVFIPSDAGTTGYSGKSIPMQGFYTGLDRWLIRMISDADRQVVRPLVEANYGPGQFYEVTAKPLGKQAMENQGDGKANAGQPSVFAGGWGRDDARGNGSDEREEDDGNQPPRIGQRMSLDPVEAVGRGVLDAAELVKAAKSVLDGRVIRMEAGGDGTPPGARWVTIGGRKSGDGERKGGFPVLIDADGNILRSGGPKSLVGKPVGKVGEHFEGERRRDAFEANKKEEQEGPLGNSRSWGRIVEHQASKWGIDEETYAGIASQVWEDDLARHEEREVAKGEARKRLGLSAADINRLENQGLDYASEHSRLKGLDTIGRELAAMYPLLGWGGGYDSGSERDDYDALVWDLIKEGKQSAPSRVSREFHERVDDYLGEELKRYKGRPKQPDPEFDAIEFSLETQHAYSSTQFNLTGDLAFQVRALGYRIEADDLAEDGREENPHITVKFGLHTNDAEEVRTALSDQSPVAVQFGPASYFAGAEHDVVKIDVISKGIRELNATISEALPNTTTYPDYVPHVTIAYVKPGLGEKYAAVLNDLEGRTAVFDRLTFSDKNRVHTSIPLTAKAIRFSAE